MARRTAPELLIVDGPADIPDFATEQEEAEFWMTHRLSDRLLEGMRPLPDEDAPRPRRTRAISIRVDEGILERLQVLAEASGRPYQSLLKQFVAERVELEELKAKEASAKEERRAALQRMNGDSLQRIERTVVSRVGDSPPTRVLISYTTSMDAKERERLDRIVQGLGVDPESLGERATDIDEERIDATIVLGC